MKVFFDHQIFLLQKYGGISRYITKLNEYLNYQNINSKIYSPISINEHFVSKEKKIINHFKFNKIFRFCTKVFNFYNNSLTSIYLKKFKPDIIHQTYYKRNYNVNDKTPTVITVYDLIHEKIYQNFELTENGKWKKKTIKNADHIICISKQTQDDLLNFYDIDKKKTSVIHLATDFASNEFANMESNTNKQKKFLLFVGDRGKYKNFKNFIRAFSLSSYLKDEFIIICIGSVNFSKEEKIFFEKNYLNINKIKYINATDAQLISLYKNATALISPSIFEGFGLPVIEAISLGCPVMASNIKVYREILGGNAIYFDPNNVDNIKDILEKNLFSKILLNKLSTNALVHAKNYTWDICAIKTINVYKKII